jgi:hypothetical protein
VTSYADDKVAFHLLTFTTLSAAICRRFPYVDKRAGSDPAAALLSSARSPKESIAEDMEPIQENDSGKSGRDRSIFDATNSCFRRFGIYIALDSAKNVTHAKDLLQRLEIWAKYSGARAREGLSLDDRLKDNSDIKAAVLGLLDMVLLNLEQGMFCQFRLLFSYTLCPCTALCTNTYLFQHSPRAIRMSKPTTR